ncbi:p-hydroxylaminobenzoate lyase [Apiospora saccharicola]|uniref:p-hydroxylaminobenzoate lyase n=1 Tax=Apiospora saccharicola TaxID=335842 RepID=A0ABR1U5R9_9PEZI
MDNTPAPPGQSAVVDLSKYPRAQEFVNRCAEFFDEVQNLTPGKELEARLNQSHGPGTPFYEDFCRYIREGLDEGWVASLEVDGRRYRRGKIAEPSEATRFFSITAYHKHPYGEINCVVQLDDTAQLQGMSGWQGAGWTSPGPGTHHYPRVRGGRLVALFFLPAGRITYDASPDMAQPISI